MHRQIARRRGALLKAVAGLAGIAGCLAAVAYAATPGHRLGGDAGGESPAGTLRPGAAGNDLESSAGSIPVPQITQRPDKVATSTNARFGFTSRRANLHFQCRLDGGKWSACRSPIAFAALATGTHRFSVRARAGRGQRSRAARIRWRVLEPKDFSIQPALASLSLLYPGSPPVALPLVIANPNPVPIFVTGLQVTTTADPPGCGSAENLALGQSSVSSSAPFKVPAGRSVSLPTAGATAPSIQLLDLPVNQDACQNAQFPLAFSGKARG